MWSISLIKKRAWQAFLHSNEMFCLLCLTISVLCILAFFKNEKEERLNKEGAFKQ